MFEFFLHNNLREKVILMFLIHSCLNHQIVMLLKAICCFTTFPLNLLMSLFSFTQDILLFLLVLSIDCMPYFTHSYLIELLLEQAHSLPQGPCTNAFLCLGHSFLGIFMVSFFVSFI